MGADPAFLHAVLCVPVRHRIFGGDGHRETDPGRRPGDEGRLFPLLKRRLFQDTVELLKLVGLDMEEPEVVNEAVKVFKDLLDEMEELA